MKTFDQQVRELRDYYVGASEDRLAEMNRLVAHLRDRRSDSESFNRLFRHFHGFSGAAATYGLPEISRIADRGERICLDLERRDANPDHETLEVLQGLIREIEGNLRSELPGPTEPASTVDAFEVLLVTPDGVLNARLATALEHEGASIVSCHSKREAVEQFGSRLPDALIVDSSLPDGTGLEVVNALRQQLSGDRPYALVTGEEGDFVDQIEAIRSGADGFLSKPLEIQDVIDRLMLARDSRHLEPGRVLAVEDNPDDARTIRSTLENAGFEVRILAVPAEFPAALNEFKPDLILMDLLLDDAVDGCDLVRYVRQFDEQATTPVIFISTDSRLGTVMEVMRAGGEGLIQKPFVPELLADAVAARIHRSRRLQTMLQRDGLTGLLTRNAFMDRLKAIVAEQSRGHGKSFALMMFDLDHFKAVNDRWGHLVGDEVLGAFARFLNSRVRGSDVVARFGGEEFTVTLGRVTKKDALDLGRKLLADFSSIRHSDSTGEEFRVTASAGIAMLEQGMTPVDWIGSADEALYRAKRQGRNRVVAARSAGGSTGTRVFTSA